MSCFSNLAIVSQTKSCGTSADFFPDEYSMDDAEALKEKVLTLRRIGITTPEICRELGLDANTVIALLMGDEPQILASPPPSQPKKISPLLSKILSRLSEPASTYGYSDNLWTPSRLIEQFNVPRGTLYRSIKKAGLTFDRRLRCQFSCRESYRWTATEVLPHIQARVKDYKGLLYLLDAIRPYELPHPEHIWSASADCDEAEIGNPVLIYGISSSNRIAGQVYWCRKQIFSEQVLQVMQGLLDMHPNRKLFVLTSSKRSYRTRVIEDFAEAHAQLHLFSL